MTLYWQQIVATWLSWTFWICLPPLIRSTMVDLIDRLQAAFGIRGLVLRWIETFIRMRTQTVSFNRMQSTRSSLHCGVPQWSVLGPILFLLYTADVTSIAQRYSRGVHSYANDTQLYCHSKAMSSQALIARVASCIEEINEWMTSNRLKLNTDKTQFIWLGTQQQLAKVHCHTITIRRTTITILTEVTCLDVVIDPEMKFAPHIKRLSGRCFYKLRQLRSIRRSLNISSTKTLVNAFFACRVDYCNSVFSGSGAVHLRPIHSVLYAAARLIVRKRKYDEITSTIRDDLHLLPVWQRLEYKICVLVYKCLHRSAPSYCLRWVLTWAQLRVDDIFAQRLTVSWLFLVRPIKHMDRAVLRCLAHLHGTRSHYHLEL